MAQLVRRLSVGLFASSVALTLVAALPETSARKLIAHPGPPGGSTEVLLRNFSGANNVISGDASKQLGVGWIRIPFNWAAIEPHKGDWQWQKPDSQVGLVHKAGMEILPDLGYAPAWAAQPPAQYAAPPASVAYWEDFVEHVVTRYSSAPYNLRYFQVWNEPTLEATFWRGTDQEFMDMVYLPAAKIIRNHGCFVVFGGWPLNGSLGRFNVLLNYREAWQLTDFVDVHYKSFGEFKQLFDAWVASGKCQGIWQTEVGATTEHGFLGNLYSRTLYWTLQVGWRNPNEFKYFWYAGQGNGPKGESCLINLSRPTGSQLTDPGTRLAVLNQVLGQEPIRIFTQFSTIPPVRGPAGNGWALGYRVGSKNVVISFLMDRAFFQAHESVSVSVEMAEEPSRVQLISGLGKNWQLPVQYGGGRVQVRVPFRNGFDDCPACKIVSGYLVLEQK